MFKNVDKIDTSFFEQDANFWNAVEIVHWS
jgi:hypothetical protein